MSGSSGGGRVGGPMGSPTSIYGNRNPACKENIVSADRPNILHIFADQQRFDTIRKLGNPIIRTPNLDRLCREGTVFCQTHTPSPVCVAARCSMIYGQYPASTNCYANHNMPTDDRESFMGALTRTGYRTHSIGKCHFTPDPTAMRGFQSRQRTEGWIRDLDKNEYKKHLHEAGLGHVLDPSGVRGEMYYIPQPSQMPITHHLTQWVGDGSIRFVEERASAGSPWYLFSSFDDPHPPFDPPNPWHKLYSPMQMPLPTVPHDVESHFTWINHFQNRYKCRDKGTDTYLLRCMKAYYYASISFVDFQVGRMLDALERTGQLDNTLVLFTADHGEYLGDFNCFGKRGMHDVSARVPLLCRLPGRFEAGSHVTALASLVDLAPTFLALADTKLESHEPQGVDLAELANGSVGREAVFSQYGRADHAIYMAVCDRWKYIYSAADRKELLFDRQEDPQELRNRAGLIQFQDEKAEMRQRLMDHLRQCGDTVGLDGGNWKTFDGITLGPEWQWWPMATPDEFHKDPDSTMLTNVTRKLGLEGYE